MSICKIMRTTRLEFDGKGRKKREQYDNGMSIELGGCRILYTYGRETVSSELTQYGTREITQQVMCLSCTQQIKFQLTLAPHIIYQFLPEVNLNIADVALHQKIKHIANSIKSIKFYLNLIKLHFFKCIKRIGKVKRINSYQSHL